MFNLFTDFKLPKVPVVYKLTTVNNDLFYIGSTLSLHKRMKDHRNLLKTGKHSSKHMQNVYNKYQPNINVEILTEFPINTKILILLEKEAYWINKLSPKYNWVKNPLEAYRIVPGIPMHQYTLEGKYIQSFESVREVNRVLEIQPGLVADKINRSAGGFLWSREKTKYITPYKASQGFKQIVSRYTLLGELVHTYNSCNECSMEFMSKYNLTKIQANNLVHGLAKTSRGYKGYRYANGNSKFLDNTLNLTRKKNFLIVEYTMEWEFVRVWETLKTAQRFYNVTTIHDYMSGKIKSVNGRRFQKLS